MQRRNRYILTAGLVAAVLAGFWLHSRGTRGGARAHARPDGDLPTTAHVERRDIDFSIEVTGDVTPEVQVEIKPEVSGRIIHLPVRAGDHVTKGQLLVELDQRDLNTQRQSAVVNIEGAKLAVARVTSNFGRAQGLYNAKLSSQETYDNLANDLAVAENDLAKATRSLQAVDDQLIKTKVVSPCDGTILVLPVVEGQVVVAAASVNSGTSLMTIANLSDLMVVTNVNQVDVAKLTAGKAVLLRMDALHEPPMSAIIFFIAPLATVKNNIKGFEVEARIANPSPKLRPGMTVDLHIPIDAVKGAVSVPISAVFNEPDGSKILYVRKGDGSIEKRDVEIGITDYFHTQITKGAEPGEEVLLTLPADAAKS